MASSNVDSLIEQSQSQVKCSYCKKAVINSLKCAECSVTYHPSCALRISNYVFKCCKPEIKIKSKPCMGVN